MRLVVCCHALSVAVLVACLRGLQEAETRPAQRAYAAGLCVVALYAAGVLLDFLNRWTVRLPRTKEMPRTDDVAEVCIVGGGCTGVALAWALAEQGRQVVLVEREWEMGDRIVGELLQPAGFLAYKRLGLADCCSEEAIESINVRGYVVIDPATEQHEMRSFPLFYPDTEPRGIAQNFGFIKPGSGEQKPSANAPRGRSFHHHLFVNAMREKVLTHPRVTVVHGTVIDTVEEDGRVIGCVYRPVVEAGQEAGGEGGGKLGDGDDVPQKREERRILAQLTVCADGIGSRFRKDMSKAKVRNISHFVGLVVRHPPQEAPVPFRNCGHVVLARPSPILIYQISPTETRVLVDIQGRMPSQHTGALAQYFREKTAPQLPTDFRPAFLEAVERGGFKAMQNKAFAAQAPLKPGAVLIGDALNMRHPLTGGGMTVSARDVEAFSNAMREVDFGSPPAVEAAYARFLNTRRSHATTVNVLANALYAVFSSPDSNQIREDLRTACYDYLNLGSFMACGPVNLLSGLAASPGTLTTHFFMVACYGFLTIFLPAPSPSNLMRVYNVVKVACRIIMPMLQEEMSTPLSWWPVRKLSNIVFPWEGRQVAV